ncbi:hypothetical protein WJX74_003705 [Apatococcus lobatus]|uniref:Uncharacterized protein n=1 Tax=Apatococcus lobatus TaxID=904363 RepID=A0AAW1PZ03_9CHLO
MPSGRDNFLRTGLPLLGLVVGGWIGISWMLQGRLDIKGAKEKRLALDLENTPPRPTQTFDLNQELQRLKDKVDIDKYENQKVPRPEDS